MRSLLLLLAFLPALSLAQSAPSLASLKDKNRVFLVFAPSDRNPDFQQQFALLSHHSEQMKNRDLIVIPVVVQVGEASTANTLRNMHPPVASDTDQIDLRHRFHIASGQFAVILIGKDGSEKLRQNSPITAQKLDARIDAMPMRKEEMREQTPH